MTVSDLTFVYSSIFTSLSLRNERSWFPSLLCTSSLSCSAMRFALICTARSEEWIVSIWLSPARAYGCRRVINRGSFECKFRSAVVLWLAIAPHWLPVCHTCMCNESCHTVYSQTGLTNNGHSLIFMPFILEMSMWLSTLIIIRNISWATNQQIRMIS